MATIALDTYREIRAAESRDARPARGAGLLRGGHRGDRLRGRARRDPASHRPQDLHAGRVQPLQPLPQALRHRPVPRPGHRAVRRRRRRARPPADLRDGGRPASRRRSSRRGRRCSCATPRTTARTVRSIMQTWGVRSMLGVPMIVREDVVGILYLDNEAESHPFTEQHQAVASAFAHLAGIAIQQAQRAAELRTNLQTVARQNELLRHSTAIEEKLTRLVLEGGTLADIATAASDLTGKPCAIHDAELPAPGGGQPVRRRPPLVERARRRVPAPAGRRVGAGRAQAQPARRRRRRAGRRAPAPLPRGPRRPARQDVGLPGGHGATDRASPRSTSPPSRHAATAIAIELSVEGRATAADRQAREGLVRDLVNGLEDHAALVRRAELAELPDGEPAPGLPARRRRTRPPRCRPRWSSARMRRSRPASSRG